MSDHPLFSRIETSRNLPSLPHILLQLIDTCNRPEKGIRELARVINQDPSLSERILRLVNSAYYSLKQKVSSIDQALLLLGTDAVKNIAISSSVYQVFNRPMRKSAFDLKLFWWHSLSCATVARLLARRTRYPSPDEAFLGGLLHDIGKIVLWVNFEQEYERLLESAGPRGPALLEGERRLGSTHAEAGAWLIQRWNLRSFLPDALLYHHDPPERVRHSFPLVQIVYAANLLCPAAADGEIAPDDLASARVVLGVEAHELESAAEEGAAEVRETARSLEIEIRPPTAQEAQGERGRPADSGGLAAGAADEAKSEELAALVRDFSLIHGFSQAMLKAEDTLGVLQVLRQAVHLLLDVPSVFYFGYEPPVGPENQTQNGGGVGGALVGLSIGSDDLSDLIRDLRVPFQEQASLLVQALVQHKALDSFAREAQSAAGGRAGRAGGEAGERQLSILDEQLVRFLGTEGMLCLPLRTGEDSEGYVGVLLLGLDRRQREALGGKRRLLSMIVNLSTVAVQGARQRERQLQRVREERFGAISEVARRIVHEAHNPLGIVGNYLSILGGKLAGNESVQEDLRILREEIRRVSQIIGELSSFSSTAASRHEAVEVNALLRDLSRITGEALGGAGAVKIQLRLENRLPVIRSDANRLKQVFLNLVKNAAEAMPGGGTVTLESRRLDMEPPCIEVCVRDQGGGIPEEVAPHVFEPFHSTKGHQGLGLSIVYGIVRELGGSISFETGEAGTVFRLRLPI